MIFSSRRSTSSVTAAREPLHLLRTASGGLRVVHSLIKLMLKRSVRVLRNRVLLLMDAGKRRHVKAPAVVFRDHTGIVALLQVVADD